MEIEQTITPAQLEILEKLLTAPLETDEDLAALGEIFGEDEQANSKQVLSLGGRSC
jgi:hypothetical protein